MHIEHIALWSRDIPRLRDFYVHYFGGISDAGYHNAKTGFRSYFIRFGEGARLELMSRPDIAGEPEPLWAGYAHVAFVAEDKQTVDTLTGRLCADGYTVVSGPRTTGDGYYESCVLDPDKNQVEITAPMRKW